jgi:stage II sporulation protein R
MSYYRKILISVLFVAATLLISYAVETYTGMCKLNDKVIRLHVIANSDDFADQQLKYKVRNKIISDFDEEFALISSKEDSQKVIIEKIDEIRNTAEKTVKAEGYDYPVDVYYGNYKFPRKQYEDIVLPEGNYDALRIEIGKAGGQNWWCVMFPPLCFVDFGSSDSGEPIFDVDTENRLKEVLTEEEIQSIKTKRGLEGIRFKSKIFEFIDKGRVENSGVYLDDADRTYAFSLSDN